MITDDIRIAFLLGSGVNIPAGMPSTDSITKMVLSGKKIRRLSDGTYRVSISNAINNTQHRPIVQWILQILKLLMREIKSYYNNRAAHKVNYEELYYMVEQISDSISGEYENPAVIHFYDKLLPEIKTIIKENYDINIIFEETKNYIRDIVWNMLKKEPEVTKHLRFLLDAYNENTISKIYIFTTNHDTVLENYLESKNIKYIDGFGKKEEGIRYWNPELFNTITHKIFLIKLHGSINWFRLRIEGRKYRKDDICIPCCDIEHRDYINGNERSLSDGRPLILIGTFNKMIHYTRPIYSHIYCLFHNSLRSIEKLIVCGYSFNDKGINNNIIEWVNSKNNNRIIVIHPEPKELKESVRGAIKKNWDDWKMKNKIYIIDKKIEDTHWEDIKALL